MKVANWFQFGVVMSALPLALAGCGGGGGLPENNSEAIQAFITAGDYKSWHCEPAAVAKRGPSPHGVSSRVCSNDALSATAAGANFPKDSAAVKEINLMDGKTGYAYYRKTQDDSAAGMGWYYWETSPPAPMPVAAQGAPGCVGCHSAAGMDDMMHLKEIGARDFVYVQVTE
jgi:hypothetical protein